jgi:hypothetical protein
LRAKAQSGTSSSSPAANRIQRAGSLRLARRQNVTTPRSREVGFKRSSHPGGLSKARP